MDTQRLGSPGDDVLDGGDGTDHCAGGGMAEVTGDTAVACEQAQAVP